MYACVLKPVAGLVDQNILCRYMHDDFFVLMVAIIIQNGIIGMQRIEFGEKIQQNIL